MPRPAKTDPARECSHCHAALMRKRINGRLEDRNVFLARKYCDRKCMAAAMIQPTVSRGGYAQRARKTRGVACEECGAASSPGERKALTVNHKNRDWSDNRPENLETLCSSCHMKKHWSEPGRLYECQPTKVCIICGRGRTRGGYCGKHWQRFKKYGDPMLKRAHAGGPIIRADN